MLFAQRNEHLEVYTLIIYISTYNVNMHYYEVLPATASYHGKEPLTYQSSDPIKVGQTINIPFRNKQIMGIVVNKTIKPTFESKNISDSSNKVLLPQETTDLLVWLKDFYPAALGAIIGLFLPKSLLLKKVSLVEKPNAKKIKATKLPDLTNEQQTAYNNILQLSEKHKTFLLHGETGSGKTRIYIEIASEVVKKGRSVLVLTPEIALTAQLVNSFEAKFNNVLVLHSSLSDTERKKVWNRIMQSQDPLILIGPRSALFAPLTNIGLIVVDEAHEAAYKQDQAPRYNALRVASKLAALHDSMLIFGSATPTISEYFIARHKKVPILRLKEQAVSQTELKPDIQIIDLKKKDEFTKNQFVSDLLLSSIKSTISKGEQALLFLNRRGTARLVCCQNCGWQALCPRCDLPLTYHGDTHSMRCHTCGYRSKTLSNCPVCSSTDIVFKSFGTKAVASAIESLVPEAKVARFDTDNLRAERFEKRFDEILEGKINVLVGTQILAKGLDLPKLSLVGIIAADNSLYFPDYTSEEKTYQIITQVMGRVARGHRPGKVIIQTYNPEGTALLAATNKDWDGFYENQLKERQQFGFPPFYYILKLSCRRKTVQGAIKASTNLANKLKHSGYKIEVVGPSPAFYEKFGGGYRWQLIIKAKDRKELIGVINDLPSGWDYDLDPANLL